MKLITRDTDYAINALYLMAEDPERVFTVTELTEKLNIPRAFLRKILQILSKKKMVRSFKGKGGEFKLNECILNKSACPGQRSCVLKKKIDTVEEYVESELKAISLSSLMH